MTKTCGLCAYECIEVEEITGAGVSTVREVYDRGYKNLIEKSRLNIEGCIEMNRRLIGVPETIYHNRSSIARCSDCEPVGIRCETLAGSRVEIIETAGGERRHSKNDTVEACRMAMKCVMGQ